MLLARESGTRVVILAARQTNGDQFGKAWPARTIRIWWFVNFVCVLGTSSFGIWHVTQFCLAIGAICSANVLFRRMALQTRLVIETRRPHHILMRIMARNRTEAPARSAIASAIGQVVGGKSQCIEPPNTPLYNFLPGAVTGSAKVRDLLRV